MKHIQNHICALACALSMLGSFASTAQTKTSSNALGLNTICIDPGHGGKDPGAVSRDGKKVQEKDIVLSVGLKLRKLLNEGYPGMKVVMTRDSDKFIELNERANIANKANADLFISLHINAVDPKNNRNWQSVSGFSLHTLGQSRTGADLQSMNMELCKRENSVILMENDHDTKYEGFDPNDPQSYIIFNLMQNANLVQSLLFADEAAQSLAKGPVLKNRGISQDPFLVLWRTTMPSVLIECGFITSTNDLAKMSTEAGQEQIAKSIYNAIVSYKKKYDSSVNAKPVEPVKTQPAPKTAAKETAKPAEKQPKQESVQSRSGVYYGTQVIASAKLMKSGDSFFKGYEPTTLKSGTLYKYFVGVSEDIDKARKQHSEIVKKFPGSFFVKVDGESVQRVK
ncbi:MAG: N-acetylmuramoyl-L-alanine amidase [Bacteroidales bacterium]|nr:N-acetylmuramoyl-L-alanine amidase [Bacteroidales bacterium]